MGFYRLKREFLQVRHGRHDDGKNFRQQLCKRAEEGDLQRPSKLRELVCRGEKPAM